MAYSLACPTDADSLARRAASHEGTPDQMRGTALVGSPEQVAGQLAEVTRIGADRVYLHVQDVTDVAHLDLIATEVLPRLADRTSRQVS